jgi:RNA polymerase sigma factor (TIGR02999 family)
MARGNRSALFSGLFMSNGKSVGTAGIGSLLAAAEQGDAAARDALFAGLYEELHRLARRELARRGAPVTLSPTTLLHEAYLDMAGRQGLAFPDRPRFMCYAARVMRGLIIDYARSRSAQKRGGRVETTSFKTDIAEQPVDDNELLRIGDVLDELAKIDVPLAEIVDLKFFCGFSVGEIAAMRGVSERTVQRSWEKARAYLHSGIRPSPGS